MDNVTVVVAVAVVVFVAFYCYCCFRCCCCFCCCCCCLGCCCCFGCCCCCCCFCCCFCCSCSHVKSSLRTVPIAISDAVTPPRRTLVAAVLYVWSGQGSFRRSPPFPLPLSLPLLIERVEDPFLFNRRYNETAYKIWNN